MPFVAMVLALWPALAAAGDSSVRCAGGVVSVGDSKLDLLGKCGAPTLRDAREEEHKVLSVDREREVATGNKVTHLVEQWTYDFGPNQFIRIVTLEGGRVIAIESGSYGYDRDAAPARPAIPRARCDSAALHVGDTKYEVLAKCGEPATTDRRIEKRMDAAGQGQQAVLASTTVEVEIWTYDFGPNRFAHHITLENGTVVEIGRDGYGYSRQ